MKKTAVHILVILAMISILFKTCSQVTIEDPVTQSEPENIAFHDYTSVAHMDELQIIKRTTDYLKKHGEEVGFFETHMQIHYELEEPAILLTQNGDYIEYGGDYLEVRLYQTPQEREDTCEECFVIYMAENGSILGYGRIMELD